MKNLHQNLLILLALALCVLCAWQWYGQTLQRNQMDNMNQLLSQKMVAIQGYTNSIQMLDGQVAQLGGQIVELKGTIKTNDQLILTQKRELNKLEATSESLTNQITEYKNVIEAFQTKLKEAYDGVKKQNEALKELVAQRDEFVTKLNDSVKERNGIVTKYNDLVARVEKLQAGGKAAEK